MATSTRRGSWLPPCRTRATRPFREGRYYDAVQACSQGIQCDDSLAVFTAQELERMKEALSAPAPAEN